MNTQIISIIIFSAVILSIITEKIDRTVAAISGAVLMILTHVLTLDKGISYIDFNTIGVLIGMMIVVSVVKNSGLFEYIAIYTAKKSKGNPWKIMICFILITALLSALLDNVTTVLLVGPMTIVICQILKINPVPFLMTEIIASNVGGTSTLIGDPPNIMIGSAANLNFNDFIVNIGPVVIFIIISLLYLLFLKKLVKFPALLNLFLGILFSFSSLQDLIISLNMFYQILSFSKFIYIFIIFIIIYILFLSFFLTAIKKKLKNKNTYSKPINKTIFIIAALIGIVFSKINFNIPQYYIISFLMYVFSCIFTFGFYHIYIY